MSSYFQDLPKIEYKGADSRSIELQKIKKKRSLKLMKII